VARNSGYVYTDVLDDAAEGLTVATYLANRYPHSTPADWALRIQAGEVVLDGEPAGPADVLRRGQSLTWRRPPWDEEDVPLAFAVLHRDPHVLAVAKPRGLPTLPAGGFLTHTLWHLVRRSFPEATPMHRLGRGTSGVVLFARTELARRGLAAEWRDRRVGKLYRALVQGVVARDAFTVDVPIGPVAHPVLGRVYAAAEDGRPALSHVRRRAIVDGGTIVDVEIPTGRPHQIRIHLAAAGHPLVGDPLYGPGGLPRGGARPGEAGYWLHAARIAVTHPATGNALVVECGPPPALR
jgi:23S rRNA pseudouridine1911/1915/1917 synthase